MKVESVIEIRDLRKKYKKFELNIDELQIPKGFATALIGENGAGKSTLLNILSGIRRDYKGQITFFSGNDTEQEVREKIGYTGPGNYFMPHWTIKQVASASKLLFDGFDESQFDKLCEDLSINTGGIKGKMKMVHKLSDGMRMKLMLATVFARKTECLLLDEPASPLDPLMRDKLCNMIREYLDDGNGEKSVFFSTHNISDMENVCDYAVIMEQGNVVEKGFVEDLKEKYILIKGEAEDYEKVKPYLFSSTKNTYGFEGICLSDQLESVLSNNIVKETPTLSQISVAIMKKYTQLKA